jgi:hypothetical protein
MLTTIWIISSFIINFLIIFRIPTDSSSQNFTLLKPILGSPRRTDQILQTLLWFLTLIFFIVTSFLTLQST